MRRGAEEGAGVNYWSSKRDSESARLCLYNLPGRHFAKRFLMHNKAR